MQTSMLVDKKQHLSNFLEAFVGNPYLAHRLGTVAPHPRGTFWLDTLTERTELSWEHRYDHHVNSEWTVVISSCHRSTGRDQVLHRKASSAERLQFLRHRRLVISIDRRIRFHGSGAAGGALETCPRRKIWHGPRQQSCDSWRGWKSYNIRGICDWKFEGRTAFHWTPTTTAEGTPWPKRVCSWPRFADNKTTTFDTIAESYGSCNGASESWSASDTNLVSKSWFGDNWFLKGLYRLLRASRLSHHERQSILVQTSNSSSFHAVRRALRTLYAEDWPRFTSRWTEPGLRNGKMRKMTKTMAMGHGGVSGMIGQLVSRFTDLLAWVWWWLWWLGQWWAIWRGCSWRSVTRQILQNNNWLRCATLLRRQIALCEMPEKLSRRLDSLVDTTVLNRIQEKEFPSTSSPSS